MPEQYVATDKRTGLEVSVTGAFPDHPQDRIRIARTTNLFTKLTATILDMDQESDRREAFRAFEVQMEVAEALIRQDMDEVRRLLQETLAKMGVSEDQLRDLEQELRKHFPGYDQLGDSRPDVDPDADPEPPRNN